MMASGGAGVFYESRVKTSSKRGNTVDTTYTWFTKSGEGRVEMRLPLPGVVTPKFIVIGRAEESRFSVILSPKDKRFSLNVIDTELFHAEEKSLPGSLFSIPAGFTNSANKNN